MSRSSTRGQEPGLREDEGGSGPGQTLPPTDSEAGAGIQENRVNPSRRARTVRALNCGHGWVVCASSSRAVAFEIDGEGEALHLRVLAETAVPRASAGPEEVRVAPVTAAFEEVLNSLPRHCRQLSVVLDEPLVKERLLHLPRVGHRMVQRLVDQAASLEGSSVASHRIAGTSVQAGREGLAVLVAMASGELLDGLELAARQRHLRIQLLASRPIAGLTMMELFGRPEDRDQRCLMVEIRRHQLRMTLVAKEGVRLSRRVDLGGEESSADVVARCITEVQRTNIFMMSRFRETPADRVVVVSAESDLLQEASDRISTQFQIPVVAVLPRLRLDGVESPEVATWAADAAAIQGARSLAATGALSLRAPVRVRRRRALLFLPVLGLLATAALSAVWTWDREARITTRNLSSLAACWRAEAAMVPPDAAAHGSVTAARTAFAQKVADLEKARQGRRLVAPLLQEIFGRLPADVVLTRAWYRAPLLPQAPPGALPQSLRGTPHQLVLEGAGLFSLHAAAARLAQTVSDLEASTEVWSCRDNSGNYDPFAAPTGLLQSLYPVSLDLKVRGQP